MAEVDEVLAALEAADDRTALVTIVDVRGSTYRREGAKLVVPPSGDVVGNISGGCLETEVVDAARDVVSSGTPRSVTYDLTADDEAVWGWGLGCNGVVEVFIEPAGSAARTAAAMRRAREQYRPLAVVTVLDGDDAGARIVLGPDGDPDGSLGSRDLDAAGTRAAQAAMADGHSRTVDVEGHRCFVEVLDPPPRLVVCGAGHDALPMAEFGARLGWRVAVVDDRPAFLTAERFPWAEQLVDAEPAEAAERVDADERTYVVVMSHNFLRDRDYLRSFLPSPVPYIAMLGPAKRLERLLGDLAGDGVTPSPDALARVHGPAGLDVGAEGPEEIAWAITSEILAVRRGAAAGHLRDRSGPIHDRPKETT